MLNSFEYKGIWWLPTNVDRKIMGTLYFKPKESILLDLNGLLDLLEGKFHPLILGETSDGKKVTLYKNLIVDRSHSYPGYPVEKCQSQICFEGYHYTNADEIKFNEIRINYTGLEEWMSKRHFFHTRVEEEGVEYQVSKFKMPDVIEVRTDNVDLDITYSYSTSSGGYFEDVQKTNAWISIKFDEKAELKEIFDKLQKISDFISLGIGDRINLRKFKAKADYLEDKYNLINIYYITYINEEKKHYPFSMIYNYGDIEHNFHDIINNWFDFINTYNPSYELFFSTFKNPYKLPIDEFLSLVQSLESYHSRKYENDNVMNIESYKIILESVNKIIAESTSTRQEKQFLLSRTTFWNRKSLRNRIKELYGSHSDEFDAFIDNKNTFIDSVVKTRNFYTHYDPKLESRIIEGNKLPLFSQQIKWMLLIIILKEMGFNKEQVLKSLGIYQRKGIQKIY